MTAGEFYDAGYIVSIFPFFYGNVKLSLVDAANLPADTLVIIKLTRNIAKDYSKQKGSEECTQSEQINLPS